MSRTLWALSLQPREVLPLRLCSYRFTHTSWFTNVSGGAAAGSCQGIRRARPAANTLPQLQRMTAPVRQMRGYLGSYTEQLSLPREGSDGKEPTQCHLR